MKTYKLWMNKVYKIKAKDRVDAVSKLSKYFRQIQSGEDVDFWRYLNVEEEE